MSFEPPPAEAGVPADRLRIIDSALARHGLARKGDPWAVPNSVLNHNYRVETARGPLFVRIHAPHRSRERLELEHRAMAWAGDHDVPVNLPLVAPDGVALHAIEGKQVCLYPWLDGVQLVRGAIDIEGARALGDAAGRTHAALASFTDEALAEVGSHAKWDTEASILALSRVDDLIRYYPAPGDWQLMVQEQVRLKLSILESGDARPLSDFAAMPQQPCHGDFHEGNVLFHPDRSLLAVVDWERVGTYPAVFEVLRCLTFSHLLDPGLLEAFLSGYARHTRFRPEDCETGVEMWYEARLHDTWAYTQRFIEGDRRVERFFPGEGARLRPWTVHGYRAWLASELRRLASK